MPWMVISKTENYDDISVEGIRTLVVEDNEMNRRDAGMIPIIAVSANAFAEDVINSRLAGVNIHLAKPLDINKMIHALKQCMADNVDIKLRDDL